MESAWAVASACTSCMTALFVERCPREYRSDKPWTSGGQNRDAFIFHGRKIWSGAEVCSFPIWRPLDLISSIGARIKNFDRFNLFFLVHNGTQRNQFTWALHFHSLLLSAARSCAQVHFGRSLLFFAHRSVKENEHSKKIDEESLLRLSRSVQCRAQMGNSIFLYERPSWRKGTNWTRVNSAVRLDAAMGTFFSSFVNAYA